MAGQWFIWKLKREYREQESGGVWLGRGSNFLYWLNCIKPLLAGREPRIRTEKEAFLILSSDADDGVSNRATEVDYFAVDYAADLAGTVTLLGWVLAVKHSVSEREPIGFVELRDNDFYGRPLWKRKQLHFGLSQGVNEEVKLGFPTVGEETVLSGWPFFRRKDFLKESVANRLTRGRKGAEVKLIVTAVLADLADASQISERLVLVIDDCSKREQEHYLPDLSFGFVTKRLCRRL